MLHRIRLAFAFALPVALGLGCQTLPVHEIPANADPEAEIGSTETLRTDAVAHQADVLAPSYFSNGEKKLARAKQQRTEQASHQAIMQSLSEARANFVKANEVAAIGASAFPEVIQGRADALKAGAKGHDKKHFQEADEQLRDIGDDLEDNDTNAAVAARKDLAAKYSVLELASIRERHLGRAERLYDQAVKEGAQVQAPRTLATTKANLDAAEKYLSENRHDEAGITTAAATATDSANRLLLIVRDTKNLSRQDAEALVLERERSQAELTAQQNQLRVGQEALATSQSREAQLAAEKAFNDRFSDAKARFTAAEADVYRQGNGLVMRLKGLTFPNGKSEIQAGQKELLNKVKDVANLFTPAIVNIEGHTDSSGSAAKNTELSMARAKAVQEYLMQNGADAGLKVNAEGFGDARPLANNKDASGRAQNRRVDVIVIPENAPAESH